MLSSFLCFQKSWNDINNKIRQAKLRSCHWQLQIIVEVSICDGSMSQTTHWLVSIEHPYRYRLRSLLASNNRQIQLPMIMINIGLKGPDWNVFLLETRFHLNFVLSLSLCVLILFKITMIRIFTIIIQPYFDVLLFITGPNSGGCSTVD